MVEGAIGLLRGSWSRNHVRQLAAAWSSWDAFADHHGLDPLAPTDADLVAFVEARALAGVGWGAINGTLTAVRVRLEGALRLADAGSLTIAATRHLADQWGAGVFDPARQAPVLPLGQIVAMVQAASPRDAFLIALTYVAGLRPAEWTAIDLEHVQADARGVKMLLPDTKTGRWQKVQVEPLPGTPLDIVALAQAWLDERGTHPGPLVCEPNGDRLGDEHVKYVLRAVAAAAGICQFSPYSLRRSMAVHADLLGVPGPVIRQRLRHAPDSQTYRRYIEPVLGLMDRDGAKALYLNATPPQVQPVPVSAVKGGGGRFKVPRSAFAAGNLDQLLSGIDLPSLRVPKGLADTARSTIEQGQAVFRRWAAWAQARGTDPTDPSTSALTGWVVQRLTEVDAVSVESELSKLRIGWLDATGREEFPGWETASVVAGAAADQARASRPPRFKSRPAIAADRAAVCAQVAVGDPPLAWAVACLSWATGASVSVEVLEVSADSALVAADGHETRVRTAPFAVLDPVEAAERVRDAGKIPLNGSHSKTDVLQAAQGHSEALRDRVAVVLVAGSGTRPSDIARARVKRLEVVPGGLAVFLSVAKGRRPGRTGRDRLIWAPNRDGDLDPVAAWDDWAAWHPASIDGPLLPRDVLSTDPRGKPLTASEVSALLSETIAAAGLDDGLTGYGFRYGRGQEMHDQGLSDEAIAEALGHDDLNTTRGYIQNFDPFADGHTEGFAAGLTQEKEHDHEC